MMENINVSHFFNQLDGFFSWVPSSDRRKLEEFYGDYLPLEAWVLLSAKDKIIIKNSNNGIQTLSVNQIISIRDHWEFDFLGNRLVPLVYTYGAEFMVYDFSKQVYSMLNICDELPYHDYQNLNDFIQKQYEYYTDPANII